MDIVGVSKGADLFADNMLMGTLVSVLPIGGFFLYRRLHDTHHEMQQTQEPLPKTDPEKIQAFNNEIAQIDIEKHPFRLSGMLHILTNKIGDDIKERGHTLYYDIDKEIGRYIVGDNDYLERTLELLCKHLITLNENAEIILHLFKEKEHSLIFELYNTKAVMPKREVAFLNALEDLSETADIYANQFVKAKKIAKAMNGTLTLKSHKKRGTYYELNIPFYPDTNQRSNQGVLQSKLEGKRVLFIGKTTYEIKRVEYIFKTFGLDIEHMHSDEFEKKRPNISKYDMLILRSFNLKPKHLSFFKQVKEKNGLKIIMVHEMFESEKKIELSRSIADAEIYKPAIIGDIEEVLYQMYVLQSRAVKGINNLEVFNPATFKIRGDKRITKKDLQKFDGAYIVVAEDSKVDQRIIRNILDHDGYRVFYVSNGQEVLDLLEKEPIDMIFSDINMPVMDGLLMTKKIRQKKEWDHIPIVSISSMAFGHEVKAMQVAGMNAAITKPIIAEDVYEAMEKFLKVSPKKRETHLYKMKMLHDVYHNDPKILDIDEALRYFESEEAYIKALSEFVPTVRGSTDMFAQMIYGEHYRKMANYVKTALPFYKKIQATEMVRMFEEILAYLSYENRFYMAEYAMLYQKNLKALLTEIERYLVYMGVEV